MAKISRILIKDFRSIRKLEVEVPKKGVVVKGKNAKGKTSFINAISAALAAQGIGAENIRHGEDRAEIQVDIDALKVRRTITANSSQLVVTTKDGDRWTKPQGRLLELMGSAGIDPLTFFLAKADERRRQVIEAMPLTITAEQLLEWIGAEHAELVATLGVTGHALDVVGKFRELFYDRRTEANRTAKDKRAAVEDLADRAAAAARHDGAPTPIAAEQALATARARVDELRGRQSGLAAARAAGEQTRSRIAELEAEAQEIEKGAPADPNPKDVVTAEARQQAAAELVASLEVQLETARDRLATLDADLAGFGRQTADRAAVMAKAGRARDQAAELKKTLAGVASMEVSEDEATQAAADLDYAQGNLVRARENDAALALDRDLKAARTAARAADDAADVLDGLVKKLTTDVPRELVAGANVIPGLAFEGDQITLDGTPIDGLSGAEQMRFAVDLARRLNAKGKILVVDGLERLDGDRLAEFITMATADDFQLFATKVENGDLVIDAIEN